jgi:small subunit ribosomal protein S1
LEENPWDVFETLFTVGSVHQGTILSQSDKGVMVALPYGVEGFAFSRAIQKEDGSTAKVDETLDFKVIEFSKENKKINLSHTKIWQDKDEDKPEKEIKKRSGKSSATNKIVEATEKTTLGDLEALQNLRDDLKNSEEK